MLLSCAAANSMTKVVFCANINRGLCDFKFNLYCQLMFLDTHRYFFSAVLVKKGMCYIEIHL